MEFKKMTIEEIEKEYDETKNQDLLEKTIMYLRDLSKDQQWVVVMEAPRVWGVVEDYDGIEQDYGNMSGVFPTKESAWEHAYFMNR